MDAADILVSPHRPNADGSPFFGSLTKLFEYMAMGKGIVASDLDQIGDILKNRAFCCFMQKEILCNGAHFSHQLPELPPV